MRVVTATTLLLLVGCGGPSPTTIPRVGTEVDFFKAACNGSTYVRCYESLTEAAQRNVGSTGSTTFAICEYSGADGAIVTVGLHDTPESACSAGGRITSSRVYATVDMPNTPQ